MSTAAFVPISNPNSNQHLSIKCNFLETLNSRMLSINLVVRKPAFHICENKDADQLRGNREADQRLVFATSIVQSLYFLNTKFQTSSHLVRSYSLKFVWDLVGNPEDRFSQNEDQSNPRQATNSDKTGSQTDSPQIPACSLIN